MDTVQSKIIWKILEANDSIRLNNWDIMYGLSEKHYQYMSVDWAREGRPSVRIIDDETVVVVGFHYEEPTFDRTRGVWGSSGPRIIVVPNHDVILNQIPLSNSALIYLKLSGDFSELVWRIKYDN
jgi:hypothetical protein